MIEYLKLVFYPNFSWGKITGQFHNENSVEGFFKFDGRQMCFFLK